MVKKEVFEWIQTGQKTIELRKGRAREGDKAVEGRFTIFLKPSYSLFKILL
jgi:hypothetical protein